MIIWTTRVFFLTTFQVIESCIDKKFVPIASILHEVQIKGREIFYEKDIETAFDLKVSGVIHASKISIILLSFIINAFMVTW